MIFIGNYTSKLDTGKGRTAIPAKFRQLLGKKAIVTQGFEKSLLLVKESEWESVTRQVTQASFLTGVSRQTERFLLGSAFEIDLDTQGRFIIPQALRKYAGLGENLVFVGVGNRVEIWDEKAWNSQQRYLAENIAQISEKLDERISQESR
jgi:MraZ protein